MMKTNVLDVIDITVSDSLTQFNLRSLNPQFPDTEVVPFLHFTNSNSGQRRSGTSSKLSPWKLSLRSPLYPGQSSLGILALISWGSPWRSGCRILQWSSNTLSSADHQFPPSK